MHRRAGLHFGFPYCHGGHAAPIPSSATKRPCSAFRPPGAEPRAARRGARHALLHRDAVSRRVPQPDLHRRARLMEPQPQDRLSRHDGDARRRQGGALRALRRRLAARARARGGVRRTCWSRRTARCSFRTTTPARSIASGIVSRLRSGRHGGVGTTPSSTRRRPARLPPPRRVAAAANIAGNDTFCYTRRGCVMLRRRTRPAGGK